VNEKKGVTSREGFDPSCVMTLTRSWSARSAMQRPHKCHPIVAHRHLVLTTVHANNVFDVIGRFASMGIDAYNFLAALNCVLAQRLVRMVCLSCRAAVKLDKRWRKNRPRLRGV